MQTTLQPKSSISIHLCPAALISLWGLCLLPLIFLGYGSDADAWRVAQTAGQIWNSGHYVRSRTMGFPLYEFLLAPLTRYGGWYLTNAASLLCGGALLLAFLRAAQLASIRELGHSGTRELDDSNRVLHPLLTAVAFAFLPVIVKNASSTMDYVPALAILMWAYVCMLGQRWIACAALIGLACGFRLTSGLFVLPVLTYAFLKTRRVDVILKAGFTAAAVGLAAYSPVLLTYGLPSPYSDAPDIRTRLLLCGHRGLRLFGVVQSAALLGLMPYLFWKARRNPSGYVGSPDFVFHLVNIAVWLALFPFLPDEPEYLLPAVPSVILLLSRLAGLRVLVVTVCLLLSYHVVQFDLLGGQSGARKISPSLRSGFTIEDIQARVFTLSTRRAATVCSVDRPTILMLGQPWIPVGNSQWVLDPKHNLYRQKNGLLYLSEAIQNESKLKALRQQGFRLVLWKATKSDYTAKHNTIWQNYVEVIDSLDDFFGTHVRGRGLYQR